MLVVIAGWVSTNAVAIAAILAGLAGTMFTTWTGWRMREADRRDQRLRVAALALGAADGLLIDLHPNRLRDNVGLSRERLDGEQERWQSIVRPGLSAIAVAYPTPSERDLASRLAGLLGEIVNLHRWYVMGREQKVDPAELDDVREQATDRHRRAVTVFDQLGAAIRGDAPSEAP